jgi:photosystem II biogenesis protein Psp29
MVGDVQTVADSKRRFYAGYRRVIPGLYRRVIDELLVELHLLRRQQGFRPDALFATGLGQVFDNFTRGLEPADQREMLLAALCSATDLDAADLRLQASRLRDMIGQATEEQLKGWLEQRGEGAPEPLQAVLRDAGRPDFHYSRLHAVGLMAMLQDLTGGDDQDPEALRSRAREVGLQLGLQQDKLDKDMGLYVSNLEKMAQAVELMEETVAAERRKRERRLTATADGQTDSTVQGDPTAGVSQPLN